MANALMSREFKPDHGASRVLTRVGSAARILLSRRPLAAILAGAAFASCALVARAVPGLARQPALAATHATSPPLAGPVTVRRFTLPGPMAGVVARVDLRDPRVGVAVVMADATAGSAEGCPSRLDVPSSVARRNDFTVAINGSFFTAAAKEVGGRQVPYFVGNCADPVGWHFSEGRLRTRPTQAHVQATLVVHASGALTMHPRLEQLPRDTRCAVGGNALVVAAGRVTSRESDRERHPRSAVGISADGGTLLLVAVDGRQEGHSRGATLAELGGLMKGFGAFDAINLDGGGSTAMVVKDRASGAFAVVNRPSDLALEFPGIHVERPVVDILGVRVREPLASALK